MDELESMSRARSILDNSETVHNSRPPLRWIANWAGNFASRGLLHISYMEENAYTGWRYNVNLFLWKTLYPIYQKYGTYYKLDWDMSGPEWDDYDENGIPYWEKTGFVDPDYNPWDFEDDNGDAFRIIR